MTVRNILGIPGLPGIAGTGALAHKLVLEHPHGDNKFEYDLAVVGLGPVGLRTLQKHCIYKDRMLGFDVSESRLAEVASGSTSLTLLENKRIAHAMDTHLLKLSANQAQLSKAAVVIICVPTELIENDAPDYLPLRHACNLVVNAASPGQLIVLTTTTYAGGTRELIVEPLRKRSLEPGIDIQVAFSPERADTVLPHPINIHAPRLVGGYTNLCREAAVKFFGRGVVKVQRTNGLEAAEMTKLFETAYRAVNTALANEFAQACSAHDISIAEVLDSANLNPDDALGFTAGSGTGGYELPFDPHHLLSQSETYDVEFPVLEAAMASNKRRPSLVVERCARVLADLGKELSASKVLVIGLSNHPDTADLFGSPALAVMALLLRSGADVGFHDHHFAGPITLGEFHVSGYPNPRDFGADLIFVHTVHTRLDLSWISNLDTVIDGTYRAKGLLNSVSL